MGSRRSEKSYQDLDAWREAMNLTKEIYAITGNFPAHEVYTLTQQVRRAVVSIPSNIAEGHGRQTRSQFRYFTRVAYGSLSELETQMIVAGELKYLQSDELARLQSRMTRVGQLLNGLLRHLAG